MDAASREDGELLELTRRAAEGDADALARLLELHLPRLRGFVRVHAGAVVRRNEAESDIVQSVCREVLAHAEAFRHPSEGAFRQWLFKTALRKLANRGDYWRAQRRDAERLEPTGDDEERYRSLLEGYRSFSTPSAAVSAREEVERVEAALAELSEEHREVIVQAHLVGLSRREIGEASGRSEAAVRVLLHRALAQLAVRLGAPRA